MAFCDDLWYYVSLFHRSDRFAVVCVCGYLRSMVGHFIYVELLSLGVPRWCNVVEVFAAIQ